MTPEQRLARLRDDDAWMIPPLRPRLAYKPRRREQSFFAQVATVVVAGAAVGGILVAGISVYNQTQERPPAIPATPEPTATDVAPNPVAWSSPPAKLLDGDCNAIATEATMAELMGTSGSKLLPQYRADAFEPRAAVMEHNGGLTCQWSHDAEGEQSYVVVDILPAAAFDDFPPQSECADIYSCSFSDSAGAFVFSGVASYYGSDPSTEKVEKLVEDVVVGMRSRLAKISDADVPPLWSQRPGDWDAEYSCDDLATFVGVPFSGSMVSFPENGDRGPGTEGFREGLGATSCGVGDHMAGASIQLLSGGAWVEDRVKKLDGIETINLEGADRAYRWTLTHQEGGVNYLFAIKGENLLVVSQDKGMTEDLLPGTAVGVLAYLD